MGGMGATDGPGGRFDAQDLAVLRRQNGGNMASEVAIRAAVAAIRADGIVEAAEVRLFERNILSDADVAAAGDMPAAAFDAVQRTFDIARRHLHEDMVLPGSAVRGQPPQFASPLTMINSIGQIDEIDSYITGRDGDRCAAAVVVENTVFLGPAALQAEVEAVRSNPLTPPAVRQALQGVDVRHGQVAPRTLHLLMEGEYHIMRGAGASDSQRAISADQVAARLGATGPVQARLPSLPVGGRVMATIATEPGGSEGHAVMVGRDAHGYFLVDSNAGNAAAGSRGAHSVTRFRSEDAMRAYLEARTLPLDGGRAYAIVPLPTAVPPR